MVDGSTEDAFDADGLADGSKDAGNVRLLVGTCVGVTDELTRGAFDEEMLEGILDGSIDTLLDGTCRRARREMAQ